MGKRLVLLQLIVALFSVASVLAKLASREPVFSLRFFLFYGAEFLVLAVYAFFWQRILKKTDVSVAYLNRATVILWSLLWSVVLFQERITLPKLLGVALVMAGVFFVNRPEETAGDGKGGEP